MRSTRASSKLAAFPAPPSSSSDSLSPPKTSRIQKSTQPFTPHQILYPIKEYDQSASGQAGEAGTKWVGLTPLYLIQRIVLLAEKSPGSSGGLAGSPLLRAFLTIEEDRSTKASAGQKRKSEHIEAATFDTLELDDKYAETLVGTYCSAIELDGDLKAWDIFPETDQLLSLGTLAKDFEGIVVADPTKQWIVPSYNRVQQAFVSHGNVTVAAAQVNTLMAMISSAPALSAAASLLALEKCAVKKPPSLPEAFQACLSFEACLVSWVKDNFANPFPDEDLMKQLGSVMVDRHYIPVNEAAARALHNKDSAKYRRIMMDEAVQKIQTWLTNQRTRHWRPSLVKAFNAKRPAALLLEDAVQFYSGKSLRPILNWDGKLLDSCGGNMKVNNKNAVKGKAANGKAGKAEGKPKAGKQRADGGRKEEQDASAEQPPALPFSPICSLVDEMKDAEGVNASHVDEMAVAETMVTAFAAI